MLQEAQTKPKARAETILRRLMDILLPLVGLLVLSPILVMIGILIVIDSPGPVLFTGRRLGKDGMPFPCYKFRTMFVDSDRLLEKYLGSSTAARQEWEEFAKIRSGDPRVTRIGKWLRRFSLDELPQLLNTLVGHMSLVGPRPYLPSELMAMGAHAENILGTKPGITGLWQVSGRNEISFEERVKLESRYALEQTLRLDIELLLRTIIVVFRRNGAY